VFSIPTLNIKILKWVVALIFFWLGVVLLFGGHLLGHLTKRQRTRQSCAAELKRWILNVGANKLKKYALLLIVPLIPFLVGCVSTKNH
jgi:cell division protein FtsB